MGSVASSLYWRGQPPTEEYNYVLVDVVTLADDRARLRVDADRYSFIVSDLHRLLLAGLSGALRKILDMCGRPPQCKKNLSDCLARSRVLTCVRP